MIPPQKIFSFPSIGSKTSFDTKKPDNRPQTTILLRFKRFYLSASNPPRWLTGPLSRSRPATYGRHSSVRTSWSPGVCPSAPRPSPPTPLRTRRRGTKGAFGVKLWRGREGLEQTASAAPQPWAPQDLCTARLGFGVQQEGCLAVPGPRRENRQDGDRHGPRGRLRGGGHPGSRPVLWTGPVGAPKGDDTARASARDRGGPGPTADIGERHRLSSAPAPLSRTPESAPRRAAASPRGRARPSQPLPDAARAAAWGHLSRGQSLRLQPHPAGPCLLLQPLLRPF